MTIRLTLNWSMKTALTQASAVSSRLGWLSYWRRLPFMLSIFQGRIHGCWTRRSSALCRFYIAWDAQLNEDSHYSFWFVAAVGLRPLWADERSPPDGWWIMRSCFNSAQTRRHISPCTGLYRLPVVSYIFTADLKIILVYGRKLLLINCATNILQYVYAFTSPGVVYYRRELILTWPRLLTRKKTIVSN